MTLLDKPAKVDREGERLYFYAPGECCVDITSGTPENRARVMALLENMQGAYRVLLRDAAGYGGHNCHTTPQECSACKPVDDVLHKAGLLGTGNEP